MKHSLLIIFLLTLLAILQSCESANVNSSLLGSHNYPRTNNYTIQVQITYSIAKDKYTPYDFLLIKRWVDGKPTCKLRVHRQGGGSDVSPYESNIDCSIANEAFRLCERALLRYEIARDQSDFKGWNSLVINYLNGIESIGAQFFRGPYRDRYPEIEQLVEWMKSQLPQYYHPI